MKIGIKLSLTVCALSLIIIGMFLVTYLGTRKQKYDSLVINLAGRQRMLSQKMTKEALLLHHQALAGQTVDSQQTSTLQQTAHVFATTLNALTDSGNAPLSLEPQAATGYCPPAQGSVHEQLSR